jgi:hypothetical protein
MEAQVALESPHNLPGPGRQVLPVHQKEKSGEGFLVYNNEQ